MKQYFHFLLFILFWPDIKYFMGQAKADTQVQIEEPHELKKIDQLMQPVARKNVKNILNACTSCFLTVTIIKHSNI